MRVCARAYGSLRTTDLVQRVRIDWNAEVTLLAQLAHCLHAGTLHVAGILQQREDRIVELGYLDGVPGPQEHNVCERFSKWGGVWRGGG